MSFPFLFADDDYSLDPVSGLPGLPALAHDLAAWAPEEGGGGGGEERRGATDFLLLLELYPQARDAERALAFSRKSADYLHSLLGQDHHLYSLGLGVFALIWSGVTPDQVRSAADKLLSRLRREGYRRAHVGLAGLDGRGDNRVGKLLDQAWESLGVARKRGPFGLCLAGSARLFPPPGAGERSRLNRLWRGRERFALLDIRQDQPAVSNHFSRRVRAVLEEMQEAPPVIFLSQREILVYLDYSDEPAARRWYADFQEKMRGLGGSSFSVGIALYPCLNLAKSQSPVNARKALLHAEMLGPDSLAVFSAISLNISGDAYYNEGDIRRAVAEYRLGLALDPSNINLLNSLGVALIQLNQTRSALGVFGQALKTDPDNFMALVNLGFAHLSAGDDLQAMGYFERALAVNSRSFDLLLQLGKLYLRHRRYSEAVELLRRCVDDPMVEERRNADLAAANRMLGRALAAEGQIRPAMAVMEKALALNPRDAGAMSLLGELYALNGEGDEIALSLCGQATELEPKRGGNWRRLGWVRLQLGMEEEAREALRRALRINRRDAEAAEMLARLNDATVCLPQPAAS